MNQFSGLSPQHWQLEARKDGILILSLERKDASVNTLCQAVLNELDSLDLIMNCEQRGSELKVGLEKLMTKYPFIGDVRGKGLLQAFELVSDRETMAPLPKAFNAHLILVDIAYKNGLIIYSRRTRGGEEGDHFLVCPPLSVSSQQIGDILRLLETSLEQFADVLLSSLNINGASR